MEEFIDDVKVVINALGYKVLEPLIQKGTIGKNEEELLHISSGSANAVGKLHQKALWCYKELSLMKIKYEISQQWDCQAERKMDS